MPRMESNADRAPGAPVTLRAIGFWKSEDGDPRWIHPRALVDWNWRPDIRARLADYLRSGEVLKQYMGYSWCRFRCDVRDVDMGTNELTDGVWSWPAGLHHYVERHGIALPEEFAEEVSARQFMPKPWAQGGEVRINWGFWGDWSLQRRPVSWWKRFLGMGS